MLPRSFYRTDQVSIKIYIKAACYGLSFPIYAKKKKKIINDIRLRLW